MKGFFNINKPRGMNSTKVVAIIKRLTHEKVGHLGTLDPDAHGVLPIAVGKATRLFDFFLNKDKVYEARGRFGILTDTLDESGRVVLTNDVRPTRAQVEAVLPLFCGKQMQMPPAFSAKQVGGERAYDKARRGEEVTLTPREICVYSLELLSFEGDEFSVRIHCSAGTYVRALIRDIAEKLGAIATTIDIFRTRSGAFDIASSISIDNICHCERSVAIPLYAAIIYSTSSAPPPWGRVVALRQMGFILVFTVIARSISDMAIPVYNGRPLSVYNRVNNKPKAKPKNKLYRQKWQQINGLLWRYYKQRHGLVTCCKKDSQKRTHRYLTL